MSAVTAKPWQIWSQRQILARLPARFVGRGRSSPLDGIQASPRRSSYRLEEARCDVERVIAEWGVLPGPRRLAAAGYGDLARFLHGTRGGRVQLLVRLGYDAGAIAQLTDSRRTQRRLRWTQERIEREAERLLRDCTEWPSDTFFRKAGAWNLLQAIKYHGGRQRWANVLGLPMNESRAKRHGTRAGFPDPA